MALELLSLQRPYEINFSGNPIVYSFAFTPFGFQEQQQDLRIQVIVQKELGKMSQNFIDIYNKVFYPNQKGVMEIDINSIVDPYLKFVSPKPRLNRALIADEQYGRFRIVTTATINGQQLASPIISDPITVIKGGLAYEKWHPSDYFAQTIAFDKKPLHFFTNKEIVRREEPKFLYWLYPLTDPQDQYLLVYIKFSDGDTFNGNIDIKNSPLKWSVNYCPIGYNQLINMFNSIDTTVPDKIPVFYNVTVKQGSLSGEIIVDTLTFFIEHRNNYNPFYLIYTNSVGGVDSISILGVTDASGDYNTLNAQRIPPPSGYENALLTPQNITVFNDETEKFNGNTNFISKDRLERLRDLFLSVQVFEAKYKEEKFYHIPVIVNKKNVKFYSNKDRLFGIAIEWQHAFSNRYYTPYGTIPDTFVCPALTTFEVRQITKDTIRIIWAMPMPYDQLEVQIDNGVPDDLITEVLQGNSGSQIMSFVNTATYPDTAFIDISGRVICDQDIEPPSLGPVTTTTLEVLADLLPIANDDTFYLAAGFAVGQRLNGNALDNDYDPDGDAIEVIDASGPTTKGGLYHIFSDGQIDYQPPSPIFNGTDSFDYTIQQISNTALTDTATVRINVGNIGLGDAVYIKVTERNHTEWPNGGHAEGDFFLTFWADPLGTIPKNLSGLGITARYKLTDQIIKRSDGTVLISAPDINYEIPAAGTEVFIGHLVTIKIVGTLFPDQIQKRQYVMRPGTGYIAL